MKYELNTIGADYVVGDIHGCFSKLQQALNEIGFNEKTDRLFSVGDLVDRGPESDEVLDWLAKPWFYAIRGNHDQMAIDVAKLRLVDEQLYIYNGGQWFLNLSQEQREYYANILNDLPLWAEVQVTALGVSVGLVHGDPPYDWSTVSDFSEHWLLWGRQRIQRGIKSFVKNIDRVYVGHTPVKEKVVLGNVHYIDTGAVFGRNFHIERIN